MLVPGGSGDFIDSVHLELSRGSMNRNMWTEKKLLVVSAAAGFLAAGTGVRARRSSTSTRSRFRASARRRSPPRPGAGVTFASGQRPTGESDRELTCGAGDRRCLSQIRKGIRALRSGSRNRTISGEVKTCSQETRRRRTSTRSPQVPNAPRGRADRNGASWRSIIRIRPLRRQTAPKIIVGSRPRHSGA